MKQFASIAGFSLCAMALSAAAFADGLTVGSKVTSDPAHGQAAVVTINGHNFGYLPMPGGEKRAPEIAARIRQLIKSGNAQAAGLHPAKINGLWVVAVNKRLVSAGHIITADPQFAARRGKSPEALAQELTQELNGLISYNAPHVSSIKKAPAIKKGGNQVAKLDPAAGGRIRSLADNSAPTTASGWYDAGMEAYGKMDYDKAEQSFQKAVDMEPTYTEAYLALAGTQAAAKKSDALKDTLDKIENRIGLDTLTADQKKSYNDLKSKL